MWHAGGFLLQSTPLHDLGLHEVLKDLELFAALRSLTSHDMKGLCSMHHLEVCQILLIQLKQLKWCKTHQRRSIVLETLHGIDSQNGWYEYSILVNMIFVLLIPPAWVPWWVSWFSLVPLGVN